MRAALLPTPGDPFMLAYWLRNYETWREHVDDLVVCVNGQKDPELQQYAQRIVTEAGGRCFISADTMGHDGAMRYLLNNTTADHIVMCEDDAYVRHPEAVEQAFERIEGGRTDIVGSPRHEDYISSPLQEWGEYVPGNLSELRHGLWPAFLFIKRSHLLETDQVFGDRAWPRGGHIDGWGDVTPEACEFVGIAAEYLHLDTFFGTTFQLRAKGLRTELVHHVRVYDAAATEAWLAEDPPWFHVTNLSTLPSVLNGDPVETLPDWVPGGGLWTRRLAWWYETTLADDGEGSWSRFAKLEEFCERAQISRGDIDIWLERIRRWVTWDVIAAVPA